MSRIRRFSVGNCERSFEEKNYSPRLGHFGLNDQQNFQENIDPGIQKRRSRSAQRKRGSYTQSPSPKPKQMRGNCYICQDVKRRTRNVCHFCEKCVCLDHISKAMACSECMKTNFISKK